MSQKYLLLYCFNIKKNKLFFTLLYYLSNHFHICSVFCIDFYRLEMTKNSVTLISFGVMGINGQSPKFQESKFKFDS